MISGSSGEPDGGAEFTAEGLEPLLRQACETAELDAHGAELLRLGSNAVYRLASAPVIVRIARDRSVLAEMERALNVTRWLETRDFPAMRVPAEVAQPLVVGGRVVTFWESVQEHDSALNLGS
ncbi:hypothetical protein ABZ379_50180 [Streptomyces canus]|uniref:hypothetical protein n=1 Tax=Streptomyces canus TaxID=58343 RepID=UPI0033CD2C33